MVVLSSVCGVPPTGWELHTLPETAVVSGHIDNVGRPAPLSSSCVNYYSCMVDFCFGCCMYWRVPVLKACASPL